MGTRTFGKIADMYRGLVFKMLSGSQNKRLKIDEENAYMIG